jgi:hypothetical protein
MSRRRLPPLNALPSFEAVARALFHLDCPVGTAVTVNMATYAAAAVAPAVWLRRLRWL